MGYSLNKKMKDILADTCGESVVFTTEQIDDKSPKTYIHLASEMEAEKVVKSSDSELKDSFCEYILKDLSKSKRRSLAYYGIMGQEGSFGSISDFSKFSELKVAMGYPLNKKLRDIVSDICGDSVIFTVEQMPTGPPVTFVELATENNDESEQIVQDSSKTNEDSLFNLKADLWSQIEYIIFTNDRTFAELDYVWRQVSFWSKTVGFSGVVELKKELGYSSKTKVVDLITELYGDKLQISKVGEKIQLLLETKD